MSDTPRLADGYYWYVTGSTDTIPDLITEDPQVVQVYTLADRTSVATCGSDVTYWLHECRGRFIGPIGIPYP
jgi:hypothetical protein